MTVGSSQRFYVVGALSPGCGPALWEAVWRVGARLLVVLDHPDACLPPENSSREYGKVTATLTNLSHRDHLNKNPSLCNGT